MKAKILQLMAISLMLEIGLIHFVSAQHEYEEASYLGYLFILNFVAALLAAYGIYREKKWGWGLGSVIAAGSVLGYAWSRTLGLPGTEVESWFFPAGILSFVLEGFFMLLLFAKPWTLLSPRALDSTSFFGKRLASAGWIASLLLVAGFAYYLVVNTGHANHKQVESIASLTRSEPLTMADLEQQYGMRITLVAVSMLDTIVDVRIKVVDPHKADQLLYGSTALWVDDKSLILAPVLHSHNEMKPGQIFVMFFPTQNGKVQVGSEVSLVFGDVRVEPVTAR